MIGSEREVLIDQISDKPENTRNGRPLAVLVLIVALWVTGRAFLWESPFAVTDLMQEASQLLAEKTDEASSLDGVVTVLDDPAFTAQFVVAEPSDSAPLSSSGAGLVEASLIGDIGPVPSFASPEAALAMGHQMLWQAALTSDFRGTSWQSHSKGFQRAKERQSAVPLFPGSPPFLADSKRDTQSTSSLDRWSLDGWAFWREGSNSAPISQGRVPVYGASQIGAKLEYRFAPGARHDPRVYLRAYRAVIDDPETEIAAGLSAKPLKKLPVRLAAELRVTDNEFGTQMRPAAYAVTQIPPLDLPLGFAAELYAGAGYVAGSADTGFIDGQASVTRQIAAFDLQRADDMRLSIGAGAWGGAQRDAERLDVGPTMRLDLAIGDVPARVSIDYRERIGGDAAPVSGFAATLSTQF